MAAGCVFGCAMLAWHSRQTKRTSCRVSMRGFADPCGSWHAVQPSRRTGACSKVNGPRLLPWQFRHPARWRRPSERLAAARSRADCGSPRRTWRFLAGGGGKDAGRAPTGWCGSRRTAGSRLGPSARPSPRAPYESSGTPCSLPGSLRERFRCGRCAWAGSNGSSGRCGRSAPGGSLAGFRMSSAEADSACLLPGPWHDSQAFPSHPRPFLFPPPHGGFF